MSVTKDETLWIQKMIIKMWVSLCHCFPGLTSSGCDAGPVRPHQLHPATAASPPLYVSVVLSVPHATAGPQSIPSQHWWSEVRNTIHTHLASTLHLALNEVWRCYSVFVCVCVSIKVPGHIRPERQWHSEVQQHEQPPGNTGGNATTQTPGPYGAWYPRLVRQADRE